METASSRLWCLAAYGIQWLIVLSVIYCCFSLVPGEAGKQMQKAFAGVLKLLLRIAGWLLNALFAVLWRLMEGSPSRTKRDDRCSSRLSISASPRGDVVKYRAA